MLVELLPARRANRYTNGGRGKGGIDGMKGKRERVRHTLILSVQPGIGCREPRLATGTAALVTA